MPLPSENPEGSARPVGIRASATYFAELESLRGVAALLVFLFHADGWLRFGTIEVTGTWSSLPLAFIRGGHSGVSLFFVLSAFLLSQPFLKEIAGGRRVSRANFYRRRALRILPLYYTVVLLATALNAESLADGFIAIPYLLFLEPMAQWVEPLKPFSDVWWSLATELQFYLLLPFLPLLMGRRARFGWAALALYALAYWLLFVVGVLHNTWPVFDYFLRLGVPGRANFFLLGILAAWWYQHYGLSARERLAASPLWRNGGADLLLLSIIVAQGALLRWSVYTGYFEAESPVNFLWHLPEGMLWTALVLVILVAPLRSKILFSNRVLARVGVLSYSMYVLHLPVLVAWNRLSTHIDFLRPALGSGWVLVGCLWVAIGLLLCLGLSAITYRVIESPFLRRKRRLA